MFLFLNTRGNILFIWKGFLKKKQTCQKPICLNISTRDLLVAEVLENDDLNKILENQLMKRIEILAHSTINEQILFKEILVAFHSIFLRLCLDHKEMVKWKSEIWQNNNGRIYTIPFQDIPEACIRPDNSRKQISDHLVICMCAKPKIW